MMTGRSSSVAARRAVAVETFQSAATTIGPIQHGMSLFAITRGQFSMLDALMHVLAEVGKARVSLWTWTVAEYELAQFSRFQECGMITSGLLVIDEGARKKKPRTNRRLAGIVRAGLGEVCAQSCQNRNRRNGRFQAAVARQHEPELQSAF